MQVGVDHASTSLDRIARLHAQKPTAGRPQTGRFRAVQLATCHRIEQYAEGLTAAQASRAFREWTGEDADAPLSLREGEQAARHLLRVAAGLESAVLGEDQILMQVRMAYRNACEAGSAGPLLHRLFHAAFRAGKRVRSETDLAVGSRSLAGAAMSTIGRQLGGLRGKAVLVLGTGEMGAIAARHAVERGAAPVLLCNRTSSRAEALAAEVGAEARPWEWRAALLPHVDAVVCATGAREPVLLGRWLVEAATGRPTPLVVVDLGVPRNVELVAVPPPALTLVDMEHLSRRMEEDRQRQARAVSAAEAIVERELADWLAWTQTREPVSPPGGPTCRERRGLAVG